MSILKTKIIAMKTTKKGGKSCGTKKGGKKY
jgi:hypothetical protein